MTTASAALSYESAVAECDTMARDGFVVLRGAVPTYLRLDLEDAMTIAYSIQARKIRGRDEPIDLDAAVTELEQVDQEAAYQALPLITQSQGGRRWAAWDGWGVLAEALLGVQPSYAFVSLPVPFVNLPGTDRLLYHWHREEHYYPKRRAFLNCWAPLVRPKHAGNGTMVMARGSQLLADLPFAEYQAGPNHCIQYEVPESFVADCEVVAIDAEPGDLVVFDRRTVHASSANHSAEPTYAAVARIFDVRDDLTLSGALAVTPYGDDYGRHGMTVTR